MCKASLLSFTRQEIFWWNLIPSEIDVNEIIPKVHYCMFAEAVRYKDVIVYEIRKIVNDLSNKDTSQITLEFVPIF